MRELWGNRIRHDYADAPAVGCDEQQSCSDQYVSPSTFSAVPWCQVRSFHLLTRPGLFLESELSFKLR